jgi:hypothetical protein
MKSPKTVAAQPICTGTQYSTVALQEHSMMVPDEPCRVRVREARTGGEARRGGDTPTRCSTRSTDTASAVPVPLATAHTSPTFLPRNRTARPKRYSRGTPKEGKPVAPRVFCAAAVIRRPLLSSSSPPPPLPRHFKLPYPNEDEINCVLQRSDFAPTCINYCISPTLVPVLSFYALRPFKKKEIARRIGSCRCRF